MHRLFRMNDDWRITKGADPRNVLYSPKFFENFLKNLIFVILNLIKNITIHPTWFSRLNSNCHPRQPLFKVHNFRLG